MEFRKGVRAKINQWFAATMGGPIAARCPSVEALENRTLLCGTSNAGAAIASSAANGHPSIAAIHQSQFVVKAESENVGDTVGLTPTISRLNAPTSAVAQTPIHASADLLLTNTGSMLVKGAGKLTTFISTSTSIDASTIQVGEPITRSVDLTPGHALTVPVTITALPAVPAATDYYFIFEVTDPSGGTVTVASSNTIAVTPAFIALTPTLVSDGLPSAVVSGKATPAIAKIQVTNAGNVTSRGQVGFSISASQQPGVPGTSIVNVTRALVIPVGKTQIVSVPLKSIPSLPTGGYYTVAQVTDPDANVTIASTFFPKTVAAPFVALSASFAEIPSAVLKTGATVTITDNGNVADNTTFGTEVTLSADDAGEDTLESGAGSLVPSTLHLQPGKAVNVHLTGWNPLVEMLAPQTPYYLTFTVTDSSGNAAAAVSQQFST